MAAKSSFPGGAPAGCPGRSPAGPRGGVVDGAGEESAATASLAAASPGAGDGRSPGAGGSAASASASARGSSGSTNRPLRPLAQPFFSLMGARISQSLPGARGVAGSLLGTPRIVAWEAAAEAKRRPGPPLPALHFTSLHFTARQYRPSGT